MYEAFFGFKTKPFNMTPDPRYFYLSEGHEEALSALLYGVQEQRGLITLTGPVGVGKTTVLYAFLEQVRERTQTIFFPGGFVGSRTEFFRELCKRIGIPSDFTSHFDLTREIEGSLQRKREAGENIVLLVDEAQDLDDEELNHFRHLNNLETPEAKLLQIILCGTEELDAKLRDERFLSLRQRVAIRCVINPLDPRSSIEYILHRLHVAGRASDGLFTPAALWQVIRYARGIPRLINVVCDNALVIAFALKKVPVEEAFVLEALESMEVQEAGVDQKAFISREEVEAFCREIELETRSWTQAGARSVAGQPDSPQEERGVPEPARSAPVEKPLERPGSGRVKAEVPARIVERPASSSRFWRKHAFGGFFLLLGFVIGAAVIFLFFRQGDRDGDPARLAASGVNGEQEGRALQGKEMRTGGESEEALQAPPESIERKTVSLGQGVGAVVLERYGRLNSQIFMKLREHNPGVDDWNRLDPGIELVLPQVPSSEDRPSDFYTVQVLSLRSVEETRKAAEKLCKKGVQNVFVIQEKPDSRTGEKWVCCCVGIFETIGESTALKKEIQEQGFRDAFIIRLRGSGLRNIFHPCPESHSTNP